MNLDIVDVTPPPGPPGFINPVRTGPGFVYVSSRFDQPNFTYVIGEFDSSTIAHGVTVFGEYSGCGTGSAIWNARKVAE